MTPDEANLRITKAMDAWHWTREGGQESCDFGKWANLGVLIEWAREQEWWEEHTSDYPHDTLSVTIANRLRSSFISNPAKSADGIAGIIRHLIAEAIPEGEDHGKA